MRTTLNLDDDVATAARAISQLDGRSLGAVISELARKGLRPPAPTRTGGSGFPVFHVPADAPLITDEMVQQALDDE